MMLPMSSQQTYLRIFTAPVSVSTSIAHRWVPCGKLKFTGSYVASESSVGLDPVGQVVGGEHGGGELADRHPLVGAP